VLHVDDHEVEAGDPDQLDDLHRRNETENSDHRLAGGQSVPEMSLGHWSSSTVRAGGSSVGEVVRRAHRR